MSRLWEWIKSLFKKKAVEDTSPSTPSPSTPPSNGSPSTPGSPSSRRPIDLPSSGHYMSRDRAKLSLEYAFLFSVATITEARQAEVVRSASWARANKARFQKIENLTRVPWYVVAIINIMEAGTDFSGTLLNGDPWNKKTVHYPARLGPWDSWEDAAIFAIRHEAKGWNFNLDIFVWDIPGIFFFLEAWNGFNARSEPQYSLTTPKGASPYIYSGTPFYTKGKKLEAPSRFEPELVSAQIGCMAFLKELERQGERIGA